METLATVKKLSPKQAITAKCKECIYDPYGGGGTWVQQIENCTSPSCPLFELRPISKKTRQEREEKYLATLSPSEKEIVESRRRKQSKLMLDLHEKGVFK